MKDFEYFAPKTVEGGREECLCSTDCGTLAPARPEYPALLVRSPGGDQPPAPDARRALPLRGVRHAFLGVHDLPKGHWAG